jgi:hypothetical protein
MSQIGMEKGKRKQLLRRSVKPACFLVVVSLLFVFSRVVVPYAILPGGATGLPEDLRSKVIITSLNGATQMTPQDITTEDEAPPLTFDTWNQSTDSIVVEPRMAEGSGCSTIFTTIIDVNIVVANALDHEVKGALNVTVTDVSSGMLLVSRLFAIDFKPGQPYAVETTFVIETDQVSPVFLVKATFPTSSELQSAPATIIHVPLFEYLLMKAGFMSPTLFT